MAIQVDKSFGDDFCAGGHTSGEQRVAEENSRKNQYFASFHEQSTVGGNEGDRNRMGNRNQEPNGGYETDVKYVSSGR